MMLYAVCVYSVYEITLYAKNETTDLTSAQKKQLKDFMEVWKHEQT